MSPYDENVMVSPLFHTYPESVRKSLHQAMNELGKQYPYTHAILNGCDIRWFLLLLQFNWPATVRYCLYRLCPDTHGEKAQIELIRQE